MQSAPQLSSASSQAPLAAAWRLTWTDRARIALALSVTAAALACSEDTAGKNGAKAPKTYGLPSGVLNTLNQLDTSLSTADVAAGETVIVGCVGQPGVVPIPEPEYAVTRADGGAAEGVAIAGDKLTVTRAGSYLVGCTLHGGKVKDDSPATLLVRPGQAIQVSAKVDPTKIGAGAKSTILGSGKDSHGNEIASDTEGWSATIEPSDAGVVSGLEVEGRKVGTAKVFCELAAAAEAESTPASLEVIAGAPAKTLATVTPAKFVAGDAAGAEVSCAVTDAYGNPVSAGEVTVGVPAGLTLAGKKVTSDKSGKYEIACDVAGLKVEKTPGKLQVTPADPIEWQLEAKTIKPVYAAGDIIVLVGRGKDKFGNEIINMATQAPATYDPADQVIENKSDGVTKSYKLKGDGNFTFTTTLSNEVFGELAKTLGPRTFKLKADSTGPMVLITEPKRAATLDGPAKVKVKGMVVDELSAVKSFVVGNQPVKVESDGSFSFEIESVQGMNPLIWKALDEWSNESFGVQTWYYSTVWLPAAATPVENAMVKDGIGVWMSQTILDSGKHDHKAPKDIATVAEIILGTLDFGALLAGAGGGSNGYFLPINTQVVATKVTGGAKIANVKMGDKAFNGGYPQVSMTVIDGGVHLVAKIHKFSADVVLEVTLDTPPLPKSNANQTATMTAKSIEISMDLMLALDPATGKVKSEAKSVDLNLVDLDIQLSGVLGFLTNWLLKAMGPLLETTLELVVKTQLNTLIGAQLGDLLGAVAINTRFDLGPFFGTGEPTKVNLNTAIGQLIFKPTKAQAGGIILALNAAATSAKKIDHVVLGSIGRAACLQPGKTDVFNPGLKFPIEAGLRDDFVNELLFALWYGGLMQLKLGSEALGSVDLSTYGVSDLSVETDFLLPPILNTCYGDDGLKLQVGDLRLHAVLKLGETPVDIWLYGTLQATAALSAVKNKDTGKMEIGFALKGIDFLELEIEKVNEEGKSLKDLFVTLIKTMLVPQLTKALGEGLGSFPLPELDLSSFSPQIPPGTVLKLSIQQIDNTGGFTYIRGLFE